MGVACACIAPHGAEIIPELAGKMFDAFAETRKSMFKLATLIRRQKFETIVIATPHNLRLEANIGVVTSEFTEGKLEANENQIKLRCKCDCELAGKLLTNSRMANLPVVGANYGTSEGPSSCMPMDWGALVPLWFLVGQEKDKQVLLVTPSREIPLQNLVRFGKAIAETAQSSGKSIAFVASADQGHAHSPKGPYGYHSASKDFDRMAKQAVLQNNLRPLLSLPQKLIEDAKPDSVWQIAILQGIIDHTPMSGRLLSYQVPTYFGMLCAAYLPS